MLVKARAAASGGFDELLAFVKPNTLPAPEDAAARAADTAIALARATSHTRVAHRDAA